MQHAVDSQRFTQVWANNRGQLPVALGVLSFRVGAVERQPVSVAGVLVYLAADDGVLVTEAYRVVSDGRLVATSKQGRRMKRHGCRGVRPHCEGHRVLVLDVLVLGDDLARLVVQVNAIPIEPV